MHAPARDLPFGNDSTAFAREHGLGFGTVNLAAFRAVTVTLPSGFQLSASTKGCNAEAADLLYGDFASWFRTRSLVEHLPSQYHAKIRADPRCKAALAGWASCMRKRGHDVRDPAELRRDFAPSEAAESGDRRRDRRGELFRDDATDPARAPAREHVPEQLRKED